MRLAIEIVKVLEVKIAVTVAGVIVVVVVVVVQSGGSSNCSSGSNANNIQTLH